MSGKKPRPADYEAIPQEDEALIPDSKIRKSCCSCSSVSKCFVILIGVILMVAVIGVIVVALYKEEDTPHFTFQGHSKTGFYKYAAVASDAAQCSQIGSDILAIQRGSVVDAAIASLLCLGIHNAHSAGIGGGFFATIYERPRNGGPLELVTLNAREVAPLAAYKDMLNNSTFPKGFEIGVPGEILGYYEAWERFGRLPWSDLFQPAIRMCKEGYIVGKALGGAISVNKKLFSQDPSWRKVFLKKDGNLYKAGDRMTRPGLGRTLEIIAEEGPGAFYNGSLTEDILREIQDGGGIITEDDLSEYKVKWKTPMSTFLEQKNLTMYTLPPPSSGVVLEFMMKIVDSYSIDPIGQFIADTDDLLYHRIAETLKFGTAKRSFLGDPDFVDLSEILQNLTSQSYIEYIRSLITDDQTHSSDYYGPAFKAPIDSGTSHLSILGPDGAAIAITSTINTYFGSRIRGNITGIIYNNEMLDFSKPVDEDASPNNFIEPGKRPLSSMVPTLILNQNGEVYGSYGGSGGTKIIPSAFQVMLHSLYSQESLKDSIDWPRMNAKLYPDILEYEAGFPLFILEGLRERGHKLKDKGNNYGSVIQGIQNYCTSCRDCKTVKSPIPCLQAVSDFRKDGAPSGY